MYYLNHCPSCRTERWEPRVAPGPELYSREDLSMYKVIHAGQTPVLEDERFRRFFQRFSPEGSVRVLDVGCGSGTFVAEVEARGHEAWGIDFDQTSISRARERGLRNVWCVPLEDFVKEHADLRFDYITAFDVVEHLTDPLQVLETLRRHLSPHGLLTVTVPNRGRFLANQMVSDFPPHHFFRFDRDSLVRTLECAGFTDVEAEIFEYGYAAGAAANSLAKGMRRAMAAIGVRTSRPRPTRSDRAPELSSDDTQTALRALPRLIALKLLRGSAVPSGYFERAFGKGFKIIATARRT